MQANLGREAYEKALEIEPDRADTLYNLANLLKDDDQSRADTLYFRSLCINNWGQNVGIITVQI